MTGQAYGNPTLTTNATVPAAATLTIPEDTSLTLAQGMTLTNNGAIYVKDGAVFHYSTADETEPDYGILVNNGLVVMTQTVGDFKVTGDTSGYTYADNVLTIKDGANITITMRDGVDTVSYTHLDITLSRALPAGEYNATIRISTASLEDGSAMNGANVETVLIVQ